jgi:flagellar biosynthesis protein FliR
VHLTEPEIGAFIAVLCRAGALLATAPVIGDAGVSVRARLAFCVAIAFAVAANRPGVPFEQLPTVAALEIAAGVISGLTAQFVLARIAVAGQLMGVGVGLGFASEYDPSAGESAGMLRMLASTLAGLAFLSTNGLGQIVRSVATPPDPMVMVIGGTALLREGAAAFGHGLALAAPVLLAALVGNLGMAVVNRAAPGVNIFAIALAVVLVLGAIVLLATAGNFVVTVTHTAGEAAHMLAP